jgi:hypothetical protein
VVRVAVVQDSLAPIGRYMTARKPRTRISESRRPGDRRSGSLIVAAFLTGKRTVRGSYSGMAKLRRIRLLEVNLIALKPDQWEWRVCEVETPIVIDFENSRETAQIEGDRALFRLLSAGLDK